MTYKQLIRKLFPILIFLGACAPKTELWLHPTKSEPEWSADINSCTKKASRAAFSELDQNKLDRIAIDGGAADMTLRAQLLRDHKVSAKRIKTLCLLKLGYKRQ